MKVIAVNGASHSGKTTVCEVIIRELRRRGRTVGSVKEIHCQGFTLDPDPRTDTGHHRSAGSQLITARASKETGLLHQTRLSVGEILGYYHHDYVVLEGVADSGAPRLTTALNAAEAKKWFDCRTVAFSGVFANTCSGEFLGLPVFNALEEGAALVDFVEQKAAGWPSFSGSGKGIAREENWEEGSGSRLPEVALSVDGIPISLVPSLENILRKTVLELIQGLYPRAEQNRIEVRIKK